MGDEDFVIDIDLLLRDVQKQNNDLSFDQVAVVAMKDGEFAIWSSHSAPEMENMIDDALDALYEGDIMDPPEEDNAE